MAKSGKGSLKGFEMKEHHYVMALVALVAIVAVVGMISLAVVPIA